MGSTLGRMFVVSTFGESHGGGLGAVVQGCPPGLVLDLDAIQAQLERRRPGQSSLTTQRQEADRVEVLSGVFEGRTLGSPIGLLFRNGDARPDAYADTRDRYRPSHADFTTDARYGLRNWQGGGRASARETVARVAAGAIAEQVLDELAGIEIVAWVDQVGYKSTCLPRTPPPAVGGKPTLIQSDSTTARTKLPSQRASTVTHHKHQPRSDTGWVTSRPRGSVQNAPDESSGQERC